MDSQEVRDRAVPSGSPITLTIGLGGAPKDSMAEGSALARRLTGAVNRMGPEAAGTEIRIARPRESDPTGEVELIPVQDPSLPALLISIVTGGGGLWLRPVLLKWIAERKKKLDIHLTLPSGGEITIQGDLTVDAQAQAVSQAFELLKEEESKGGEQDMPA